MPEAGLEPASPSGHKNLNLACLPISPSGHVREFYRILRQLSSFFFAVMLESDTKIVDSGAWRVAS